MYIHKQILRVFGLIVFILCRLSLNSYAVDQSFPLTITDFHGVEMTIPSQPQRIVSLTLGTDEILLALVDHARIAALSGKIVEDDGISNVAEAAQRFAKVENNVEGVIALNPDLVLAASWMKKEAVQQLRDVGIPVYSFNTPTSIAEQKQMILDIAHLLGEDAQGQAMVADMDRTLNAIAARVAVLKPEERLTVLSYTLFGSTNGLKTTFDDMAAHAGLINAAAQADLTLYADLSKEKMVELNPDILIVPSWSYDAQQDLAQFAAEIKNDPALANINAVKNNRMYALPEKHLSCTSQYIVLGVEDLAKAAYPQLFQ